LFSACYQLVPDVLLVTSGFFVPGDMLDLIRARGTKVVLIHTEEPYEHDRDITRAAHADINIVNDPTHLADFDRRWVTPGISRTATARYPRARSASGEAASEFCFVGTGYPSRIAFLEQVDFTGLDVALAGNWQATDETHRCASTSRTTSRTASTTRQRSCCTAARRSRRTCTAAKPTADDLVAGWAMGPREVELAATGCSSSVTRGPSPTRFSGCSRRSTEPGEFGEQVPLVSRPPERPHRPRRQGAGGGR
jgi:spore maturation protein CgeB